MMEVDVASLYLWSHTKDEMMEGSPHPELFKTDSLTQMLSPPVSQSIAP